MFKKLLLILMLLSISIGLVGCAKNKPVSDYEGVPINIVDINGDEEYKIFYEEHAEKIKNICEGLGLYTDASESSILVNGNSVDDNSSWIDISVENVDNKAFLSIYAMDGSDKSIDVIFSEMVKIVNSYFNYNFDEQKIIGSLDENGDYRCGKGNSEDEYVWFNLTDSTAGFNIVLANLKKVSEEPLKYYITKEEAANYNIYDNGKLDKLLSQFNITRSDMDVDTIEADYINDLSIHFVDSDIRLVHNYSLYNGDLYYGNEFQIYVGENEEIKDRFNKEDVKSMFELLYEDTEVYDKILERISSMNMELPGEARVSFDIDPLGKRSVTIYRDMYDDGTGYYYIEVDYGVEVKE